MNNFKQLIKHYESLETKELIKKIVDKNSLILKQEDEIERLNKRLKEVEELEKEHKQINGNLQKQLNDLGTKSCRSMVAVIDAMCQRGAFKGEELSTIGGLRDQCIQCIQLSEEIEQEAAMDA